MNTVDTTLKLPVEQLELLNEIAKLANVSVDIVFNVMLATYIVKGKANDSQAR